MTTTQMVIGEDGRPIPIRQQQPPAAWGAEIRRQYWLRVRIPASGEAEWLWRRLSETLGLGGTAADVRMLGPIELTDSEAQQLRLQMPVHLQTMRMLGTAVVSVEIVEKGSEYA